MIGCIIYAFSFISLSGKTLELLTTNQRKRVEMHFNWYMESRKGKQNPNMTLEEYLPIKKRDAYIFIVVEIIALLVFI